MALHTDRYWRQYSGRVSSVDVRDYVIDDGVSDNTVQLAAAIAATPIGGALDFRGIRNAIRTGTTVDLLEQRTYLFPLPSRMWPYRYVPPIAGSIKLLPSFTGTTAIRIRSKDLSGRALDADGIRVEGLVVDCGAASGNIHGVSVEGLCRDLSFTDCAVFDAQGTGNGWDFRQGSGTAPPRGIRMQNDAAYSCDGNGFRLNGVTDSRFYDLLATGNAQRGLYVTNSGENSFTDCSAVFNAVDGMFIDGTVSVGMTTIANFATDRNGQSGILISQSGKQPIQIIAPRLRRDGSGSASANYAGLRLSGSAGLEVVPVDVIAPQVVPGVDDGGGGIESPQFAVRALRAQRLSIHGGDMWGVAGSFSDGGNNAICEWTPGTYWATGATGTKTRSFPTPVGQAFTDLLEQADPAAPAANVARLYARDNGSGKTQIVAVFATGAVQVIATQP